MFYFYSNQLSVPNEYLQTSLCNMVLMMFLKQPYMLGLVLNSVWGKAGICNKGHVLYLAEYM